MASVLQAVAIRMRDNYPYPHPFYAGQMLKPPHPMARLAYMLALWINPNNHALDGGRASSAMEKEAVAEIAEETVHWGGGVGRRETKPHLCPRGNPRGKSFRPARVKRPGLRGLQPAPSHPHHPRPRLLRPGERVAGGRACPHG